MFKQLPDDNAELVTVIIEERPVKVPDLPKFLLQPPYVSK